MKESKGKVPQYARFVCQKAHGGSRVLDGLVLDG